MLNKVTNNKRAALSWCKPSFVENDSGPKCLSFFDDAKWTFITRHDDGSGQSSLASKTLNTGRISASVSTFLCSLSDSVLKSIQHRIDIGTE